MVIFIFFTFLSDLVKKLENIFVLMKIFEQNFVKFTFCGNFCGNFHENKNIEKNETSQKNLHIFAKFLLFVKM